MPGYSGGTTISSSAQVGADVILTGNIKDGEIVNADIGAAAAIAGSKIQVLSVGANAGVIPSTGITTSHLAAAAGIVDTQLATISTAGKVSGAALTLLGNTPAGAGVLPSANVPAATWKVVIDSRAGDTASGTQNKAHGLGRTPAVCMVTAVKVFGTGAVKIANSFGAADASAQSNVYNIIINASNAGGSGSTSYSIKIADDITDTAIQTCVITFDGTNIIQTWTKTGSPTNNTIAMIFQVA